MDQQQAKDKKWHGLAEAIGMSGLSEKTLRRRVAAGKLETRRARGRVWISAVSLERMIAEETGAPAG